VTPQEFIEQTTWRSAMTMPDQLHEYTVRGETADEDFEWFVLYIREHGYRARFGGSDYTYLEVDQRKHRTMGAPVGATRILNRAAI
jgi:hypothetical protein